MWLRDSVADHATFWQCMTQAQYEFDAFPQSVRLSDLLARALVQTGQRAAAHAESRRGQQLRRAALCYRAEFPQNDETVPLRQIAEHLLLLEDG